MSDLREAAIELFVDDDAGVESIGLVLRAVSIVEYDGELTPGCKLTAWHARCMAHTLQELADRIDGNLS